MTLTPEVYFIEEFDTSKEIDHLVERCYVHRFRPSSLFVINSSLLPCLRSRFCTAMLNELLAWRLSKNVPSPLLMPHDAPIEAQT